MLVIILQIYTNSLQYTQISIETIFDQIPTYSLFSQIRYGSIFDHFPTLEKISIIPIYSLFSQIWYNSIFDHFPTSENFSIIFYFFTFHFRSFSTSIFDQIPTSVFDQILLSHLKYSVLALVSVRNFCVIYQIYAKNIFVAKRVNTGK